MYFKFNQNGWKNPNQTLVNNGTNKAKIFAMDPLCVWLKTTSKAIQEEDRLLKQQVILIHKATFSYFASKIYVNTYYWTDRLFHWKLSISGESKSLY